MAGEVWRSLTQVGKEVTEGTGVAATRRLYAQAEFTREREPNKTKVNTGTRDNQRDIKLRAVKAAAKLKLPLGADEILEFFLAAIQGGVSPVTANSASTWTFKPGNSLDAQTLEYFDGAWPWRMSGSKIDELKLTGNVGGDVEVEASYFGREVAIRGISGSGGTAEVQSLVATGASAGTFTLSFLGQTTAAIAYNAAAADVEDALEALASIGVGNVTCSGGALPGTPVVITFAGALAAVPNLPLITANSTSLTDGTAVVTRTTAGVLKAPLADRVPNYIQGWEAKLYVDAFGGTPGTTAIPGTLISWEWTLKNNLARKYWADNTLATGDVTLGDIDVQLKLKLEANALAMAEYVHWDRADKRLVRLELGNNGAAIGSSALKSLVSIDVPGAFTAAERNGVDANTRVYDLTHDYIYDPTNGFGLQARVQTARSGAY